MEEDELSDEGELNRQLRREKRRLEEGDEEMDIEG